MGLDEEIGYYQFGQGVHSQVHLLDHFNQLDEDGKRRQFIILDVLVDQLYPTNLEMEQAITDCSLSDSHILEIVLKHYRSTLGIRWMKSLPEDELEQGYMLLLHVFKAACQRHSALEGGNSANWRYRDLSSGEVVQDVLTTHRTLVEAIYANPGFRSEFVSIARLWHESDLENEARMQELEPTPEPQTHFTFVKYEEIVTEEIKLCDDRRVRSLVTLRQSVVKALSKRYGVDAEQARRATQEVIERHLRETYNTGLF